MEEKEFKEAIAKCESADEIKNLVNENNLNLNDDEVNSLFDDITRTRPLDDDELNNVTGGYDRNSWASRRDVYRWQDTAYAQPTLNVGDRVAFHWHPFYRQATVTKIIGKEYTGFNGYQWKYEVSFVEYNFFSADTPRTGDFFDYELVLNNDGRFM